MLTFLWDRLTPTLRYSLFLALSSKKRYRWKQRDVENSFHGYRVRISWESYRHGEQGEKEGGSVHSALPRYLWETVEIRRSHGFTWGHRPHRWEGPITKKITAHIGQCHDWPVLCWSDPAWEPVVRTAPGFLTSTMGWPEPTPLTTRECCEDKCVGPPKTALKANIK